MYKQCVRGLSLGRGDGGVGEGPGNEADTMEDCIDSALCGYGFILKTSDFHNGDPVSKNSALSTNIEFELETILSVQVVFQLNSDYCTKVLQGACTVLYWIMTSSCATINTL